MGPWLLPPVQAPPSLLLATSLQPKGAGLFDRPVIILKTSYRTTQHLRIIPYKHKSSSLGHGPSAAGKSIDIEPITPRFDGCRRNLHQVSQTPPSDQKYLMLSMGSSKIRENSTRSSTASNGSGKRSESSKSIASDFPGKLGLFPADEWDLYEAAATGAQVRVVGPATMVTRGVTPEITPSAALVTWNSQVKVTEVEEASNQGNSMEFKNESAGGTWSKGPGLYTQAPCIMQTRGDGSSGSPVVAFPLASKLPGLGRLLLQCGTERHVVQKGEWGALIARRYGVSLTDLSRANPGLRLGKLVPGQSINLPAKARADANPTMAFCAGMQWVLRAVAAVRKLVIGLFQWLLRQQQQLLHWQQQQWSSMGKLQQLQGQGHQQQEDQSTLDNRDDSIDDDAEDEEEEVLGEWVEAEEEDVLVAGEPSQVKQQGSSGRCCVAALCQQDSATGGEMDGRETRAAVGGICLRQLCLLQNSIFTVPTSVSLAAITVPRVSSALCCHPGAVHFNPGCM